MDQSPSAASQAVRWLPVLAVAGGMLAAGPPDGLTREGWLFAAVFAGTIVGFLTRPLPMAPLVLIGLLALLVAGAFGRDKDAIERLAAGFADATVWLVVAAFLLSGTVVRTGFGRRIALMLIRALGGTTLGLGYSIAATEVLLGPLVPSNTARGGGIMLPVVRSLALALGAEPDGRHGRTGGYLVLCGSHANLLAAAMFFTGMAANPILELEADKAFGVRWDFMAWLTGSIVPGAVAFLALPLVLYWAQRPELVRSPQARDEAADELRAMGPWSFAQIVVGCVLAAMVAGWATARWHGVDAAGVALMGIAAFVVLRVDRWRNFVSDGPAWDSLFWLGGLVAMADQLREHKVIAYFTQAIESQIDGYTGVAAAILLALAYFFSMYGFSMLTGHIVAMAGAFFVVAKAADCPPLLTVALISYFSNLCGCLTNYSTGQVVIYFGLGYVSTPRWFAVGLLVAVLHLATWLGVGLPYWKALGWW
jgi:DASS family divalent anion:Na+ symporter